MKTNVAILLVAFTLAAGAHPSLAQQTFGSSSYPRAWISGGMGLGSGIGEKASGSVGVSANFALPRTTLLGQVALNGNWSNPSDDAVLYTAAAGLSPGYGWASDDLALAGFAGPALVWGREQPSQSRYLTGGFTLGGQFFVTPALDWGLGMDLFANLNPVQSSIGVRFAFLIGSAR